MKGLLHSKKFRDNLYKWLIAYVGVMLLLTTVITYSKYISSLQTNDEARTTKFKVNIDSLRCIKSSNTSCDKGIYFRDEEITYSFIVDTSELEANADFLLTITINKDFTLEKIVKSANGNKNTICSTETESCKLNELGIISLLSESEKDIKAGRGTTTGYEVTVKYKGTTENPDEEFKDTDEKYVSKDLQIITLDYSATQTD